MPPAVHQVQKFTFNDLPEPARPPPNKNIPTSVPREPRLFHRTHAHISRRRTWPRAARPALVETHAASRALNFVNCRTVHEQSPEPPPRPGAVAPGAAVAGPRSADGGGGGPTLVRPAAAVALCVEVRSRHAGRASHGHALVDVHVHGQRCARLPLTDLSLFLSGKSKPFVRFSISILPHGLIPSPPDVAAPLRATKSRARCCWRGADSCGDGVLR